MYIGLAAGVQLLTLSSTPKSEGNHLIACPGTAIAITCSATQVTSMSWRSMPGSLVHSFVPNDYNTNDAKVVIDDYTLTLVETTNVSGNVADLISDLKVMIDDIANGTIVTCKAESQKSLTIYKESKWFLHHCPLKPTCIPYSGPPSPPSNFTITNYTLLPENYFITLSWKSWGGATHFSISINTTTPRVISTNMTAILLEGEYDTWLEITVLATNCAGNSSEVSMVVYKEVVHMQGVFSVVVHIMRNNFLLTPSWLSSSQSTHQWQC